MLAATHDLELAELLAGLYRPMHFADRMDHGGLCFDYRLRQGVTTGRNAIDLLEHVGYPRELVDDGRGVLPALEGHR